MFELLAQECAFHDAACINMFRDGGPLFGVLPVSGNGVPVCLEKDFDPEAVCKGCCERNGKVLAKLRACEHSDKLLSMSEDEVKLGRLSGPVDIKDLDLSNVAIASRFGVEQGNFVAHCSELWHVECYAVVCRH